MDTLSLEAILNKTGVEMKSGCVDGLPTPQQPTGKSVGVAEAVKQPAEPKLPLPNETHHEVKVKVCRSTKGYPACGKSLPMDAFSTSSGAMCRDCFNAHKRSKAKSKADLATSINTSVPKAMPAPLTPSRAVEEEEEQPDEEDTEVKPIARDDGSIFAELMPMLNRSRFTHTPSWHAIGKVLYHLYKGSTAGFSLWRKYILCYGPAVEDALEPTMTADLSKLYNGFCTTTTAPLTIKTIAYFAKMDSQQRYDTAMASRPTQPRSKRLSVAPTPIPRNDYIVWHNNFCQEYFDQALSGVHSDVALAVYNTLWLDHVWSGKEWYYFNGNHLVADTSQAVISKAIDKTIINVYRNMKTQVEARVACRTDKKEAADLALVIKSVDNLIKKLGSLTYQNSIITYLKRYFLVPDFDKYLNKNPFLTGVTNGIIELNGVTSHHRPGMLEDMVTRSCTAPYDHGMDKTSQEYVFLARWFDQLFWEPGLKHFVLKWASSVLVGRNFLKKFPILIGDTNGGKSSFMALFEALLGEYFRSLPAEVLDKVTSRGGSGPTPELNQTKGGRLAMIPEADDQNQWSKAKFKKFSSGADKVFSRGMHENGGNAEIPQTGAMANGMPDIPNADMAVKERWLPIPFLSCWPSEDSSIKVPKSVEEQYRLHIFERIHNFDTICIPRLLAPLLHMLVEYYPILMAEGLKPPPCVQAIIDTHWSDKDLYLEFIKDCIVAAYTKVDGKETDVRDMSQSWTSTTLHPIFSRWYKVYTNEKCSITRPTFKFEITKKGRLGQPNAKGHWCGIKVTNNFFYRPDEKE
jgi:phage/plasmid-associated DNA primase